MKFLFPNEIVVWLLTRPGIDCLYNILLKYSLYRNCNLFEIATIAK